MRGLICPKCCGTFRPEVTQCAKDGCRLVEDLRGESIHNRYILNWPVGYGGASVVWSGRQLSAGRSVAVKLLTSSATDSHEGIARECALVSNFNHRHITGVFDYGKTAGGCSFIVMELLDGPTLSRVLANGKRLPLHRVIHIITQVLLGLEHAHAQRVVHRDLKPENIVLVKRDNTEDFVKILDFGIAEIIYDEASAEDQPTRQGPLCGTPAYMAPEQISGDQVDETADIYAIGVLMYRMITGGLPFAGNTSYEVLKQHMLDRAPSIVQHHPDLDIPAAFDEVVQRTLQKDPADRFRSASELRLVLTEFASAVEPVTDQSAISERGQPMSSMPSYSQASTHQRSPEPNNASRWIAFMAGAAALAIAVGWWATKERQTTTPAATRVAGLERVDALVRDKESSTAEVKVAVRKAEETQPVREVVFERPSGIQIPPPATAPAATVVQSERPKRSVALKTRPARRSTPLRASRNVKKPAPANPPMVEVASELPPAPPAPPKRVRERIELLGGGNHQIKTRRRSAKRRKPHDAVEVLE